MRKSEKMNAHKNKKQIYKIVINGAETSARPIKNVNGTWFSKIEQMKYNKCKMISTLKIREKVNMGPKT